MKTKKKVLLAFTTIVVCLIFSLTTISKISKISYNNTSIISICADKTGNTTRGTKSV
nr:hypothetical protein [uncultured Catonella sp.]